MCQEVPLTLSLATLLIVLGTLLHALSFPLFFGSSQQSLKGLLLRLLLRTENDMKTFSSPPPAKQKSSLISLDPPKEKG